MAQEKSAAAAGTLCPAVPRSALLTALLSALLTSSCARDRIPGAADAGSSVRAAFAAQVIHPQAALSAPSTSSLHGGAAKASVDRFVRSFEQPAPSANLFTIGMGSPPSTASPSSGGTSGGAAPAGGRP